MQMPEYYLLDASCPHCGIQPHVGTLISPPEGIMASNDYRATIFHQLNNRLKGELFFGVVRCPGGASIVTPREGHHIGDRTNPGYTLRPMK